MKTLSKELYYDKILGGWVGKSAGGILGAPIEGYKRFNQINISNDLFKNNFPNDDLDLQILWLDMAARKGPNIRENDFSQHWINHVLFPWNEYGIATRNLKAGLNIPESGKHNNWYWNQSMGSPIRSEIWGMLCPGNPEMASFYAKIDSCLDHEGFSVEAEQFLSACAAIAFFETDLKAIFNEAIKYVSQDGSFISLFNNISLWFETHGEEITAGKIKSMYGDADFTSAPMNVGFTLLALLSQGDSFDNITRSLNYGHDSDCIVATAAALIGIIHGYSNIPQIWKDRVGNDLVVSPEIKGITIPENLTELAQLTAETGAKFSSVFGTTTIENIDNFSENTFEESSFHVSYNYDSYGDFLKDEPVKISGKIEIFNETQVNTFRVVSNVFNCEIEFNKSTFEFTILLQWKDHIKGDLLNGQYTKPNFPFTLIVDDKPIDGGLPYYGKWKLIGPFVSDNPELEPMDPTYPDHGLSTMPGVQYMNHDKVDYELIPQISSIPEVVTRQDTPFCIQNVFPGEFVMNLKEYFYGLGEKSLVLYSQINCDREMKKWLSIGCTAQIKLWVNEKEVYTSDWVKRLWPMSHNTELFLDKGTNHIVIQLGFNTDDYLISIGLKDHNEKHPHQSQWDAETVFTVPE
ncbi:ADP-ribosylglycohydrolase family protein [Marinigracilibium pacificum]|uniref:ADP-ribosylglycohydrolase family protein n=1 Tax=Marinigracilibium pacificum TaxID=2729599 RepID=A0A848IYF8_9BACT|nr:ADP-ribosylglycohydrolase family protein [Marinigracilibium pacificum]NMM48361.1 ADP-ribosylglycohydrolase family protein [Marinigracilibium pacificum]